MAYRKQLRIISNDKRIKTAEVIIENDFNENGDGYDLEDCQYTITPVMMTEEEFNNLPDSD